ncbi:Biopolymer transport protein ExbD [Singulisphaera sp. GP187]|uniref:ExbD/TolR family protein n=1 Tax=Singulisphaera sp. GP187 TaxID=1882752 RepID=UPI000926BE6C|nr:biopolymer transporter ExbD [Singulisphaera sp. GP187]SIN81711.1 Biopolymer transport protein ExbD [Singulisphaera sp. GP187]
MSATATGRNRSKSRRPQPPEEVAFPVTPMLDMAFQLLAFFVLTFQVPSAETHLDLDLPASPLALPSESKGRGQAPASRRVDTDLENDLWIRAETDDLGDLKSLRLGESVLPDLTTLGERLGRYVQLMENRPLRVRLVADDALRYEEAARIIAVCGAAGVATVRLTDPAIQPSPASSTPRGIP